MIAQKIYIVIPAKAGIQTTEETWIPEASTELSRMSRVGDD